MRKFLFWLHLVAGLIAGAVIAVMAFTGVMLAFEKEILAWVETDARHTAPPAAGATQLPLSVILKKANEAAPESRASSLTLSADPSAALLISFGRDKMYYVSPYTGEVREPALALRGFFHTMETWHRFLGVTGETSRPVGKAITGACNLAFFFLAVSGLILWWPRSWTWRGFKAIAVLNFRLSGRPRNFNWHNAAGFWMAPILIVLTLTALPISYRWGNRLVYRIAGTQPPVQGQGGSAGSALMVAAPSEETKPLSLDQIVAAVGEKYPDWTELTLKLSGNRNGAPRRDGSGLGKQMGPAKMETNKPASPGPTSAGSRELSAASVTVRQRNDWPQFAATTVSIDPYRGTILKEERFADQDSGQRLRRWTRFLHTGEALGAGGKTLATLGALSGLLLVWTGVALAIRRFFKPKKAATA
jgi:uncharacterized iron-regulated membrane protein